MSIFKLLAAFFLAITLFAACKKDKDDDKEPTVQERIMGKWTLEKVDFHDFEDGTSEHYSEPAITGDYMEFMANGSLKMRLWEDEDESTWSLEGDNKLRIGQNDIVDESVFDIKTLTNNSLVLYTKDTEGADYYEATVYLKK